jgi:hypothetical protein
MQCCQFEDDLRFTRDLFDSSPWRMLLDFLTGIGGAVGCQNLKLVAAENAVHRTMRQPRPGTMELDRIWREVGAQPCSDGDFELRCPDPASLLTRFTPHRVPDRALADLRVLMQEMVITSVYRNRNVR